MQVKLSRPLDFLVVADHSDNMGFFPRLNSGDPEMLADPDWQTLVRHDPGRRADRCRGCHRDHRGVLTGHLPGRPGLATGQPGLSFGLGRDHRRRGQVQRPGQFTAFIGYEWTSNTGGNNLHRVVVYRDDAIKAGVNEPYTTLRPAGSDNPRDLWKWMDAYQDKTGGQLLAIAHNGNLSNGIMFPVVDSFSGKELDRAYAETRMKWEPLYEATQIKGDGETHPLLSADDEFADYETWDQGNLDLSAVKQDDMLQYEYARSALQIGLQLEQQLGVNPYQFGMIGSTDSHTGLATAEEENFFGKHSGTEPGPERYKHPMGRPATAPTRAGTWCPRARRRLGAREHARGAVRCHDAQGNLRHHRTAHAGALLWRLGIHGRGCQSRLPANIGYRKGVPMGGKLPAPAKGKTAPTFLVAALKDPLSGNLDRIQIVKGWVDNNGKRHEKVYDVAWSGERQPGADGKLPAVGNTVDVANATWTNSIGAPELIATWVDPDFDPALSAVYYARVLEIPTPRWTAYEAKRFGIDMPAAAEMVTQERAYTSPIWYTPG